MTYTELLSRKAIAISISESSDMAALGLASEHLQDAMAEIARHLLAMGARIVYGGDLRSNGFTELLFELVARHRRDADIGDTRPAILNYLASPVVASKSTAELRGMVDELVGLAELHFLDSQGRDIEFDALNSVDQENVGEEEWANGLTAMRQVLTRVSDARIVLGGRTLGYKGRMPGIAEEALAALEANQPLFLLGGFGGCARDIAVALNLLPEKGKFVPWKKWSEFSQFDGAALGNGLSHEENATLVSTVHVDEAITLILRGLFRLTGHAT